MIIAFLIVLFIVSAIAHILFLVEAFSESIGWGLACLFIPLCTLIFACLHWERIRNPFLVNIFCSIACLGILFTPQTGVAKTFLSQIREVAPAAKHEPTRYEALSKKIGEKKLALADTQARYNGQKTAAFDANARLSAVRKSLNERDAAAVKRFNADLAVYNTQLASLRRFEADIAATETEVANLVTQRESVPKAVSTPPKVVLYTTSSCPYCSDAKAYLARRGIQYENHQVDQSREEFLRFKSLGGDGVPLIYIGDEHISGFNEQWMNDRLR